MKCPSSLVERAHSAPCAGRRAMSICGSLRGGVRAVVKRRGDGKGEGEVLIISINIGLFFFFYTFIIIYF